jgi:TPR repeat protein
MKHLLTIFLLLTLSILSFGTPAFADFQKGADAYKSGDYATAFKEWKPLADEGDAVAQSNLGAMYHKGYGVAQDYEEAVKWFRLSADQGVPRAQFNLGVMYNKGHGVIQDYPHAHMLFNISASQGHEDAAAARDYLAKKMTSADISKAQDMARECVAKNYKGC